ncbi:MAG: S-layer homology domain-containing protein, partial [Oscillospiraceae bacterium]
PEAVGVYAFADTTGSTLVGCYSTASSAAKLAFVATDAIFENCYCASGTGAVSATDATRINGDQTPIDPAKMQHDQDTALVAALGFALRGQADAANYAAMTGLDMGYKAGSATNDAVYNYKAPTFAKMFVLTVNTKPSSLYGTYTVTVGGTNLAGENATGLHQYVIAEGTGVVVAGIKNDNASAVTVTGGDTAGNITAIAEDTTVIVTFTPTVRYGWTMNQDITGKSAAGYGDIAEKALTSSGSSLYGNTVAGWKKTEGAQPWAANAQHKIKTILVTGDGKFGSVINGYALPAGWVLTSGGTDKTYVQLTCELGATGAETAAVVNSVSFKGTADGTAAVRVYLDENVHGKLFAYGDSVYELSAVATNWGGAKALAENTALGGKNGHLVVIGTADEHAFLAEHVKTNAWTAAKVDVQGTNTTLTNWSWDVTGGAAITAEETAYLQNPSSWTAGEPNASGTNATYHYAGHFDDTNQNNLALIEYDTHGVAAVDWQGYSATAAGTVTVSAPYVPGPTRPKKPVVPGEIVPADPHKNGVANILEADKHVVYLVGNDAGNFAPEAGITRAEVAQLFYNLLKNKDDAVGKIAYSDVAADAWYTKAVNALSNLGIMKGVGDGLFAPERNISRAEFTVIALRFADDIEGTVTFKDVPAEHWASSAISGAAQYGWIMGYTDGTFKPLGDIQRAEAAKIVNTMLGRSPDKTFIEKSENLKTFPDVERDHWAFYDIAEATNAHEFTKVKNVEKWSK